MSEPLVSIVLPVHNGARYLSEAIESILSQTYDHWELIVVDDASTDASPSIVAAYRQRDHRIRSVRNPTNRRLPASLNAGFMVATGELLTWTSDDNCYRPAALWHLVDFLGSHPHVGLVYADCAAIDSDGNPLPPETPRDPQILAFQNPIGACFLYRRSVLEKIGRYDERFFLVEDYDFWVRVSLDFPVRRLPLDLYLYRRHLGSLTARRQHAIVEAWERMLIQHLPRMSWLTPGTRALAYLERARCARWAGRRVSVLKLLSLAIRETPGIVVPALRMRWAGQMASALDPSLLVNHRRVLFRVAGGDDAAFFALLVYALAGNRVMQWYERLRNIRSLLRHSPAGDHDKRAVGNGI